MSLRSSAVRFAAALLALAPALGMGQPIPPYGVCRPGAACVVKSLRVTTTAGVKFSDGTSITTAPTSVTSVSLGTYASRPAAGTQGKLYVSTDSPIGLWADSGSAWLPMIRGTVPGVQPKLAASFTTFNKGGVTPTLVDLKGSLAFNYPADGASVVIAGFTEALSSATMHVEGSVSLVTPRAAFTANSYPGGGICMRETATGKVFALQQVNYNATFTGAVIIEASYWASASSRTNVTAWNMPFENAPVFLKLAVSGANILAQTSTDRQTWTTIQTTALTTAFTAAPTAVGVCGQQNTGTDFVDLSVPDYSSGT